MRTLTLAQRLDALERLVRSLGIGTPAPWQFAADRSPKGGVTVAGRFYPGGRFIPSSELAKDPAAAAKVKAVKDAARERLRSAGPTSREDLRARLQGHDKASLSAAHRSQANRAWAAIRSHHSEYALHRLRELIDADLAALKAGKMKTRTGQDLRARLAAYRYMLDRHGHETRNRARSGVQTVPVAELHVDPDRFQYKLHMGSGGAGEELRVVRKFDPHLGGILLVWHDPTNRTDYVVNGHHRYELARRTGHPEMAVRYVEAPTAAHARAIGALCNIAEGRGNAVDAAKFFRDTGVKAEQLQEEHGISLKGATARDGMALARLDAGLFHAVTVGEMEVGSATAIGQELTSPSEQRMLWQVIQREEAKGRSLSDRTVREMARELKSAPTVERQTKSLFGDDVETDSTFVERNELKAAIRRQLESDQRLFRTAATSSKAEKLQSAGGNVLNVDENKRIADQTKRVLNAYEGLVNLRGPVSAVINEAAAKMVRGELSRRKAAEWLYERVRAAVVSEVEQAGFGGTGGAGEGDPSRAAAARAAEPSLFSLATPNLSPLAVLLGAGRGNRTARGKRAIARATARNGRRKNCIGGDPPSSRRQLVIARGGGEERTSEW